jgi:hypothetical protein
MLIVESLEDVSILSLPELALVESNAGVIAVVCANHLNLVKLDALVIRLGVSNPE